MKLYTFGIIALFGNPVKRKKTEISYGKLKKIGYFVGLS